MRTILLFSRSVDLIVVATVGSSDFCDSLNTANSTTAAAHITMNMAIGTSRLVGAPHLGHVVSRCVIFALHDLQNTIAILVSPGLPLLLCLPETRESLLR